jgi:hypothetical protein
VLQAGHEVVEFFALNRDVAAPDCRLPFAIPFFKRCDDGLMFRHRLLQAAPEPATASGGRASGAGMQPQAFLLQKPVAGLPVQNGVEALVLAVVAVGVLGRDGRLHRRSSR